MQQQKIRWALSLFFGAIFLFSACAIQRTQPTAEMANTLASTSMAQPTKTRAPIQTKTATPTTTPKVQDSELCVKNPVPAELLTTKPEVENHRLIAFSNNERDFMYQTPSDIYTVELDGINLRRLTSYSGTDDMEGWSSNGKQIFFSSDRNHQSCREINDPGRSWESPVICEMELFVMNADGSGSRKITPDLPFYPGRSPDGKYIAYDKDFYDELRLEHGLGDYLSNIFVTNISGTYTKNITVELQPAVFMGVEWSPDGRHFVFMGGSEHWVESPDGGYWPEYVYLANADGSNLQKLDRGGPFRGTHSYQTRAWSSDGKHLAFLTSKGIAIVNSDGSGFSEYLVESNSGPSDIFWADDNQHLIFTDGNDTFYKIDTDFTRVEKLPVVTRIDKLLYRFQLLKTRTLWEWKSPNYYYYELSPDGKWLAYLENGEYPDNPCRQIRILNVKTGKSYFVLDKEEIIPYILNYSPVREELRILSMEHLLDSSRFDTLLWSPDSKKLLFTSSYLGLNVVRYQDLFAINLDRTDLHMLMDDVWNPAIQP